MFVVVLLILTRLSCWGSAVVTFGSVIELEHSATKHKLLSLQSISWSTGGQIVSVSPDGNQERGSKGWIVRSKKPSGGNIPSQESVNKHFVTDSKSESRDGFGVFEVRQTGSPVNCGDIIRFEHQESGKKLYSNGATAQLSNNYEVVCQPSEEDMTATTFIVECGSKHWEFGKPVSLKHTTLNGYLHSETRLEYNDRNCPGCHIAKHLEVSISKKRSSQWKAEPVLRVSLSEDDDDDDESNHEEL